MTQTTHCNERRFATAEAALAAYQRSQLGQHQPLPPTEETLIDILTDLRHWAAVSGIEFQNAARISEYHFEEEDSAQAD